MKGCFGIIVIIVVLMLISNCDIHHAGGTGPPPPAKQMDRGRDRSGAGDRQSVPARPAVASSG